MSRDVKEVTYRQLYVGQEINQWEVDGCTHFASAVVQDINPGFVTLLVFNRSIEKVNSETGIFYLPLTEEEYHKKYFDAALKIYSALHNKLALYEMGPHEVWNGWISYDIYNMAATCTEQELTVLGYCTDVPPDVYAGPDWNIGVAVETPDGDKFWCHYSSKYIEDMKERYPELEKVYNGK